MQHKLAAARQLGLAALWRRLAWRMAMLVRIVWFHAWRRHRAGAFANAIDETAGRTFLAAAETVRAKLAESPEWGAACRRRIDRQCTELFENRVTLRGLGTIDLQFTAGDWYAYEHDAAIMINRHDFVIPLVQNVLLNDSQRARAKLDELFTYWIEHFSLARLLTRDTPIDAAIRAINWLWVWEHGALVMDKTRADALRRILYLHVEYVRAWQSAGGNHLVLEALAAYLLGRHFAGQDTAASWTSWGRATLLDQLACQTTADGVHTEQSMFYHQAVASHYLKFFLTGRAAGDELPPSAHERFERMLRFVHETAKENGTHPVVGDGELLTSDDREHWESRALLAAYSTLFDKPVYRGFSAHLGDASCWLLGVGEAELAVSERAPDSAIYADTGLAMLRNGAQTVFFDAAPFSDPEFPHHGHADALCIDVSVGSLDLFVDPGGYGYYDDEFRRYFRSTAAHNTIAIDGKDQSELFGVLGYGRLARAKLLAYELTEEMDFVRGTHDGYAPAQHVREVYLVKHPDELLITVDMLTGDEGQTGVLRYHFTPEARCKIIGEQLEVSFDDTPFYTAIVGSGAIISRLVSGAKEGGLVGWVSPETKHAVRSTTWEITSGIGPTAFFVTAAALRPGASVGLERFEESVTIVASRGTYELEVDRSALSSRIARRPPAEQVLDREGGSLAAGCG